MSKNNTNDRNQFAMFTIDDLAPQDHLVREIDVALDSEFVYPIVEATYSDLDHPNIGPVTLIRLVLVQYLFGIRSMRQTIKEVGTNVAYRWFLGYSFEERIPHFSIFGKSYVRQFRETTVFEDIFAYVLEQAVKAGFVTGDNLYLDFTHIKANTNKHKFTKGVTHDEAKACQDELKDKINHQRMKAGKRPFTLNLEKEVRLEERGISKADPESGYYVKDGREKQFAYSAHTPCDDNGLVLSTIIAPGNIHGSQVALQLVKQPKRLFPEVNCVVADAGYKTSKFIHFLTHLNLRPCLPCSGPKGKGGLLSKNEFLYDEHFGCYICPQDRMLALSAVTREEHREYRSDPRERMDCPPLNRCTISKNHQRVITRHIWGDLMDEMEYLHLADLNKSIYKKWKQATERIFADAKEEYRICWTKYRGLEKVATHTMLVFAAMDLEKLATQLWKGKEPLFLCSKIRDEVDKKLFQARVTSLEQFLSAV